MKKFLLVFLTIIIFLFAYQPAQAANKFCIDCQNPTGDCVDICKGFGTENAICKCENDAAFVSTSQAHCDDECKKREQQAQTAQTNAVFCDCGQTGALSDACINPCKNNPNQQAKLCMCSASGQPTLKNTAEECVQSCQGAPSTTAPRPATGAALPAAAQGPQFLTVDPPKLSVPGLLQIAPLSKILVPKGGGEQISVPWIAEFIVGIYKYALGIAAVLAVLMVMFAGVMYLISAGNPQKVGQAKNFIIGAISGLVILASSYLLLYLINPDLTRLGPIVIEAVAEEAIDETEFANLPTTSPQIAGDVPYYAQTDKKWACFPFTGNECSYQLRKDGKALACGTKDYSFELPGVAGGPDIGLFSCRIKNKEYQGMNYCEWLESTYSISNMCNNPNIQNSGWCKNNPYGANNFVEFCKKASAKNKEGKHTNLNVIQSSGCGLTSSAMVLNFYGIGVIPPDVARWIQENAIRSPSIGGADPATCCGFVPAGMKPLAEANGLTIKKMSTAKQNVEVMELLQKGLPLILHVSTRGGKSGCKFTKGGHFIVVKSYKDGVFGINDPSHPKIKTASASEIWDDCSLHSITYFYKPGEYGVNPTAALTTAPSVGSAQTNVVAGDCKSIPDLSPYDSSTGCYNSDLSCTPQDIKSVALVWGQTNMITAPNSCARTASRILRNAGCNIPGGSWIKSLKGQLQNIGWKALIIGRKAARDHPDQIPIGMLFQCNNTGTLQHVFISTGQGGMVESGTSFSSACSATGCPKQNSKTCGKEDLKDKCAPENNSIPGMNALTGSPTQNYKSCGEGKNQCVHYISNGAKKAHIVFFPTLTTQENAGCCVSDLIKKSRGLSKPNKGIKTSQETCNSLYGSWTAGGDCSEPLSPSQAVSRVISLGVCGCTSGSGWCK